MTFLCAVSFCTSIRQDWFASGNTVRKQLLGWLGRSPWSHLQESFGTEFANLISSEREREREREKEKERAAVLFNWQTPLEQQH
jgi:hypothetical protein